MSSTSSWLRFGLTTAVISLAPAASAEPWAYTLEGYGYLPWVNGTTTIRGFQAETDLAPNQALNLLQFAFSARASAEKNRLGLLVDVAYTQLAAERAQITQRGRFTGSAEVPAINGVYDLALRYRFGTREEAVAQPGRWWLIPYAGVRVIQARLGVDAEVVGNSGRGFEWQSEGTLKRTWSQMLIGTQASLFVTPSVRLFGRADVGGFGLAGNQDLSGNAQAGVGIGVGNNTDLNISWRYLDLAYNNGKQRDTGFTSNQNGIEVGLKFYF
jgi:hypothetical protein